MDSASPKDESSGISGLKIPESQPQLTPASSEVVISGAYVEVIRIQERSKIIRTAVVSGAALLGSIALGVGLVLANSSPWLQAFVTVAGLALPSYAVWRIRATFRMYMETHNKSKMAIEAAVDSSRTSSGLNPDGTSRHD